MMVGFVFALVLTRTRFTAGFPVAPDGKSYTVYESVSHDLKVVDSGTGKVQKRLAGLHFGPYVVKFSDDSKLLAASSLWGEVGLWETQTGRLVFQASDADAGHLSALAVPMVFSPQGDLLAIANLMTSKRSRTRPTNGIVTLWNTQTGKLARTIRTSPYDSVTSMAFMPSPRTKWRSRGSILRVATMIRRDFNPMTGEEILSKQPTRLISTMSDDGRWGLNSGMGWTDMWDLNSGHQILHLKEPPQSNFYISVGTLVTPDGKWLLVSRSHLYINPGSDTGGTAVSLEMLEVASGTVRWTVPESVGATLVCFSPDGELLLLSNGEIRKTTSGMIVRKCKYDERPMLGNHGLITFARPYIAGQ